MLWGSVINYSPFVLQHP
ncbi:hypothetical protein ACSOR1_003952 [Escherichia coli]